ncbi:hypothetical protein JOC36_001036 [Weissella uvarum]|nr:hypothetical protein [Weissella uvarum]
MINKLKSTKFWRSQSKEVIVTLSVIIVLLILSNYKSFNVEGMTKFNTSVRGIISIFTGMLGTMIGLIFSGRLSSTFTLMSEKYKGVWGLKYRIFGAFIPSIMFITYSLIYEAYYNVFMIDIRNIFLNKVLFVILITLMTYSMVSTYHVVHQIINMSLDTFTTKK